MKPSSLRRLSVLLSLVVPAALAVGVAAPAQAVGTTWWVDGSSATCSDAGSGTQTAPFCTVAQGARKAVLPGDVLHIAPGTYREQLTVGGSGSSTDPITVMGDGPGVVLLGTMSLGSPDRWSATGTTAWSTAYAPPSAPRQVFVDGNRLAAASSATTTTAGSWFYDTVAKVLYVDLGGTNPGDGHAVEAGAQSFGVNASGRHDVVVRDLVARGQNFAGVRLLSSSNVTVDGVTATDSAANGVLVDTCTAGGVVVSGATVSGSLSTGIRLSGSTGVTLRDSVSHHNGLHGIGLANAAGNVIEGNTSYSNSSVNPNATATGIDVNTGSPDNTVIDNVTYDNQDTGIQIYNGSNRALVSRNISYRNGDHGFDTLSATDVSYLNNTSYDNRRDGISVEGNSTGARVANNLLVDNGDATNEYDLYVDPGSVPGFTADYDVAYNHSTTPSVKFNGTVYPKLAAFTTATGLEQHGGAFAPSFRDPANGDFRLTGGSAAVDSADASVAGFSSTDAAGNALADDAIVPDTGVGNPTYADRGALEFQPGPATNYAPHAALVADPTSLAVPPSATVTADASGSDDADLHGIASYSFDFGDGTGTGPQAGAIVTHDYAGTGTFTLTVTVTDSAGATDTASRTISVTARQLVTYHVAGQDPSCTDAGPGTQAAPMCTIAAATRKALAGDTIEVGPGTYREQVQPTSGGQAGAPITLHGSGPTTVISGTDTDGGSAVRNYGLLVRGLGWWDISNLAVSGQGFSGVFLDGVGHVNLTDLTVSGAGSHGITVDNSHDVALSRVTSAQNGSIGVRFFDSSNSTLTSSTTHDNQFHGVSVQGSTNITVSDVTSYGNRRPTTRVAAGIDVSSGSSGVVVQRSTAYGNDDSGIEAYTGATGTVIRRNVVYDNGDHGIDNSAAPGSVVVANTVVGNATAGINFEGSSVNAVTRDNIAVDNGVGSTRTIGDIRVDESSAPGTVLDRDLVFMSNGGPLFEWSSQPYTTIGAYRTASGQEPAGIAADPRFADPATRDLRLTGDSPAVDAAYTGLAAWLDTDRAGHQPVDDPARLDTGNGSVGYADLGALEYAGPVAVGKVSTSYTLLSIVVSVDGTPSTALGAPIVGYHWDCGNGNGFDTATGKCTYPSLTGPYTVRLTVTDANGLQDSWSTSVPSSDAAPVGRLTATPSSGYAPLAVTLDASASSDTDATPISSYSFDCGNGQTTGPQGSPTTSCSYPTAGTFTARVTVRDGAGQTGTASVTISSLADVPPTAVLTLSKGSISAGQSVVADGSGSTDPDYTPIASYQFACGNGVTSPVQATPRFTCSYPKAGKYVVRMWVTDTGGRTSTTSKNLNVKAIK